MNSEAKGILETTITVGMYQTLRGWCLTIKYFNSICFFFFFVSGNRRFGGGRDREDRPSEFGNFQRRRNDDQYQNGLRSFELCSDI